MDIATLRSLPASEQAAILSRLLLDKQQAFAKAFRVLLAWEARNKFAGMFPETGPLRRELYHHHCQFFSDGKWAQYRAFIGGNGTGKTEGGGFELVCHLTGEYPDWWTGWRFNRPIQAWCAGDTTKTVRNYHPAEAAGVERSPRKRQRNRDHSRRQARQDRSKQSVSRAG